LNHTEVIKVSTSSNNVDTDHALDLYRPT